VYRWLSCLDLTHGDWLVQASRRRPSSRKPSIFLAATATSRGGQLVVECATVCFRSQEDFGPNAGLEADDQTETGGDPDAFFSKFPRKREYPLNLF
jgi:hypothetical protein